MASHVQLPIYSVFAELVAPLVIGTMIACPLFGVTVAQAIWYFRNYPNDPKLLKYWIAAVVVIDGVQTFSVVEATRVVYLRGRLSLDYSNAYAYRPPAVPVLLITIYEGMSILQQVNGDVSLLHGVLSNAFGTAEFSSTVACDLLISASMAYYLNKRRSGIRKTENLVDRLIVYVIGIGLLTSIFAIIVFVTWVALPRQLIFLTFYSIISKLYVNSLLVTLNARSGFRPKNNSGNRDLSFTIPVSLIVALVSESIGMSVLNTGASSSTA
ncbi:hypothetical protein EYR38_008279 [Pleurotus pulmonarius]|nr:hypothetical protein EYR38_008279 [Pleurotus pulmonarius]